MSSPSANSVHVLVIDDNDDGREMIRMLLEAWGHRVDTASDGLTGVRTCLETRPDLAVIDIGLPQMDGYEVARRIKAEWPESRLVAVTGYGRPEDRQRALEAGFETHLVKPINPQALQELLASVSA